MGSLKRYELTFSGGRAGQVPQRDAVVVAVTGMTGPGGHPVYSDASGIVRAEISDRDEVRMLASGGRQSLRRPVRIEPLS
ncbi:DUF6296 family protein [Kitasatospora sp. NBC_01287]|uniref:DUF6296 family protein n=1 Tax=Kitasatospora sp. NBC_01287 TaxID=2903573 RepID=UPI00225B1956|nr:DUF6296 family protein [Kitasatospora sp. NBC_01287]MCX4751501.1 DUF6296 family protein [Kitasatospora sp. NBC_01287]